MSRHASQTILGDNGSTDERKKFHQSSLVISGSDSVDEFCRRIIKSAEGRHYAPTDVIHGMIESWLQKDDENRARLDLAKVRQARLDLKLKEARHRLVSAKNKAKTAVDLLGTGKIAPKEMDYVCCEVVDAAQDLWELQKND